MQEQLSTEAIRSISATATPCRANGSILPEALWFAVMLRERWGTNAPKDLEFALEHERSDRTCRAWSSGDHEPLAGILAALLRGDDGGFFLDRVMEGFESSWWREYQRALRLTAQEDAIDRS